MTDVRATIATKLKETGQSMAWLSRELKRNHAYIQQFIERRTPQDLEFADKVKVSKLLSIPLRDLGIEIDPPHAVAPPVGLSEDAEAYAPPPGSFLATAPHVAYFRAKSNALDQHRLAIRAGDVAVVDIGEGVLERIQSEDAVVVQCYLKPDYTTATTALRQFVKPALLITNSSGANEIWRTDDASLPFEPVIKGRVVSVIRQAPG